MASVCLHAAISARCAHTHDDDVGDQHNRGDDDDGSVAAAHLVAFLFALTHGVFCTR